MAGFRLNSLLDLPAHLRPQAEAQLRSEMAARQPKLVATIAEMVGTSAPKARRGKYDAKPVHIDDIRFASTAEGKRYCELRTLKACGEVTRFHRQVIFDLPGGTRYICDFQIFWADGRVTYEDVKGFETSEFKLKRKQVRALYGVEIEIPK